VRRARAGAGLAAALLLLGAAPEPAREGRPAQALGPGLATFAGGCFWCMEPPFDALPGVLSTTSGYTGGALASPSYEQVSAGGTGHFEALEVAYDPARVSYEKLLEVFWRNVDPTDAGGQFCDRGAQYRTAIFVHGEEQRRLAEESKRALAATGKLTEPIATEILPAGPFYAAEDYHQDYYEKNPLRYKLYRKSCGRDARLERVWGEPPRSR
jgi:peptide-methionine (S)-S-oxide reductase